MTTPAPDILQQARDAIAERAASRDTEAERSMERCVGMFNALRGANASLLSEKDGWQFMECLKMSRSRAGRENLDDYIDGAAYCALAGESAVSTHGTLGNVSDEGFMPEGGVSEFLVADGRLIEVIEGVPDDWGLITSVLLHNLESRDATRGEVVMTVTTDRQHECILGDGDIQASLAGDIIAASIENAGVASVVREKTKTREPLAVDTSPPESGETRTVDLSSLNLAPAEIAMAYREELISLGWVPPGGRELDIPVKGFRPQEQSESEWSFVLEVGRFRLAQRYGGLGWLPLLNNPLEFFGEWDEITPHELSEFLNGAGGES